jgi:hypothetical protein
MVRNKSEEGTYPSRTKMTSLQSWVSRSPVFESIDLEELQYQTWSYVVEIDRVN